MRSDSWSYPSEMNVIENGSVEIPVSSMWDPAKPNELSRHQFTLYRTLDGQVIEDCFNNIQLEPKSNKHGHYHLLKLTNLKHGTYNWAITGDIRCQIQVIVHKGKLWNNLPNFILQRNCIREIVQSQKIIKIKESELLDDKSMLRVKLADYSKDARVHLIASRFIQPDPSALYQRLSLMTASHFSSSMYYFAMWSNFYLSDRVLSDEFRYVFDRTHAKRMLGNMLDRPQLVNKRVFTRKTEMDQEVLNDGTRFAHKEEVFMQQAMP